MKASSASLPSTAWSFARPAPVASLRASVWLWRYSPSARATSPRTSPVSVASRRMPRVATASWLMARFTGSVPMLQKSAITPASTSRGK
ncbi:hypothetical protein COSO111634_28855 [Corallococcus soli]